MDGLFNFQNPQALQQQYLADRQLSAAQMAQLPLLNQVAAMGGNTGAALGTSLGRLFGGRTAAEVENETMKEIFAGASAQTEDPVERMTIAAKGLRQRGLEGRAIQLEQEAAKLQQTRAATRKTEADMLGEQQGYQMRFEALKKRMPEISDEEARALAQDPATFREVMKTPKVDTQVVETADGQILINKQTGQPIANLGRAPDRRSVTNVSVSPTIKQAGDTIGLVKGYQDLTKPQREMLASAQTAKELINSAATSNNSQAWEAARTQIAKAVGEGKLSNEDIRRTGIDPRFVQGALDWVNKKTAGVPNEDIMKQLFTVASILENVSVDRINRTAEQTRAAARVSGVPETEMDIMFPKIQTDRSPRRQPTSGGAVNWSDLK